MAWAREHPRGRRPHFFKIFFPCNSSKHLGIPRGFWRHIEPRASGYVALKGPSGNVWNVKLVRAADGSMSFQNGWEEFVADHSLGIGDFLMFRYDGGLNFNVLVFDPTSCEKEDTFNVSPCHEIKIQVDSPGRRNVKGGSVNELVTADPERDMAFAPETMCAKGFSLAVACQALSKVQNSSIESHGGERSQIVDGSLITNEVDLDCRTSDLDVLESQAEPLPLLRDMGAEIVQIPPGLDKCWKDDWMDNSRVDSSHTLRHLLPKKPPSSSKHALCKRCFLGHSDHVIREVREEPQSEQAKCGPQSGASIRKQNINNIREIAEAPLHDKSHNSPMKHKKLALRRSRKPTIFHTTGAVKQCCLDHSTCSASPHSDNVKFRVERRIVSCRRPVTEIEKAKALEAAEAVLFQSKHPSCCCVMRNSYVYRGFFMYLPMSFTQHLPKYTMEMKLRDPDNKLWMVMYKRYGRGGAFSGGWGEFSRVHNLEMDDVCVFELIKPDEIQVQIFRVVEEINPFIWNSRRRKKD